MSSGHGQNVSWIATRDVTGTGSGSEVVLIRAKPGEEFSSDKVPIENGSNLQVLAATDDQLIASTSDGQMRVISSDGRVQAQWDCGTPFISQPAVADIDGDGVNELVVCTAARKGRSAPHF